MTLDIELEDWRRDWRDQAAPMPDLRARVRRQNLRKLAGLALLVVCLVAGTTMALTGHGDGWGGFASGLWFTVLLVGGYAWRVSRGAWKPAAQTTRAYLDLVYRRAVAEERTLLFAFRFLLIAFVLYTGYLAVTPGSITSGRALVLLLLALEVPLFVYLRKRNRRSREDVETLTEQAGMTPDDPAANGGGTSS